MNRKRVIAGLALACALSAPLHAADAPSHVAIDLRPHDAQWEVRYALPQPVHALRFARIDAKGNRASSWTPVDPSLRSGGQEKSFAGTPIAGG